MLIQMNDDELQLIYQNITQLNDNEKDINDDKVETNNKKLATNICRLNKGNLLSPFLQNKALNFVNSSLYKVGQDSGSLILNNQKLQKQIT
uniref:Uncharacterized protein n=1 Tax=Rhizophagus irregularis (strain DAOM 181602 / DAOM 197198 / MUCL 43194) TaxID=747089 RepID=U9UC69_RHIID